VRILFSYTVEQIPVGSEVMPALVPVGTYSDPYPHPSGLVSAGTRVFLTSAVTPLHGGNHSIPVLGR
jgi:hypothetical protein